MHENISKHKYISCEKSKDFSMKKLKSSTSIMSVCSSKLYKSKSSFVERKQQIIDSNWGGYALDVNLWDDSKSPVVQIRPSELSLDDKESRDFLSDKLIGLASSFLTKSPENGLYILGKCVMRNKNLTDINMLQYHRHLQYIDIAYNNISDLSPLSTLSYLMYLKAAHNNIKCISNFISPWYLTYVNLSYNHMTDIVDLRNCWSIVRLNFSHNVIETISGLENLKYLQYLDLSYNLIECIRNLDNLNIRELNLEGNCITSFKSAAPGRGLNTLPNLRTIILGYNKLSTLEFFKDTYSLHYVDLKFNRIVDLLEVLNLKGSIIEVDFRGNACTKWPNYRNVLISSIPNIKFIDDVDVFAAEKVTSAMLFASPLDLIAARKVAKLTLLEQLNITKVDAHVQSYDEINPPLIVLTGPSALKKMALALHVARTISDKVKYCRWHSTKEIYEDDDERDAYVLVDREEFNDMARRGEFLVILDLLGHSYGFHTSQTALLISENKIGLTQMNLYAVTEVSRRYSNVIAILSFTQSVDLHKEWIEEKFDVYTWIKDSVENLLVVKIGKHRDKEAETASCILNFIEEIVDEVIGCLKLPTYSIHVRPQGTGATTTDIISESKLMLPRVTVFRRREMKLSRKIRISLEKEQNNESNRKSFDRSSYEKYHTMKELKVILDEESNIIVDDEETKHERRKSRMLERRSTLLNGLGDLDKSDLTESSSSDEETDTRQKEISDEEKAKALKNTYTEFVVKSRKLYLDYHESHPGFFAFVLLMDDYTEAFNLLNDFIHKLHAGQSYRQPAFLSRINQFTQAAIPVAVENILDEIRENLSTSKLQRKTVLKVHRDASQRSLEHST